MIKLVRIELLKLRTTRTAAGLLGITVLLTALDAVLRAARAGSRKLAPLDTADGLRTVCTLTGFSMLMAMLLGAIITSGEFRQATATLTYLTCPNRGRVLAAKAITAAVSGLVFGAAGAATATGVALAFAAGHGYAITLGGTTLAGYAAGATLGAALLGALGAGLGSLIRNQVITVVGLLVWVLFGESILGGLINDLSPYLPFTAATTLAGARLGGGGFGFAGTNSATTLPFAAAAALVVAVALAVLTLADRTTARADIS
jgi:ABC-type transport system involved in multi-copper enzyme maturation permease subunit